MRVRRLLTAVLAALSLWASYAVVGGATASADIPYCYGTWHVQANNGLFVTNEENNAGVLRARTPGYALGTWERFRLFRHYQDSAHQFFAIRSSSDKWVRTDVFTGQLIADLVANPKDVSHRETFVWNMQGQPPNGTFQPFGSMRVDLWVANEENQGGILRARTPYSAIGAWEQFRWHKVSDSCLR